MAASLSSQKKKMCLRDIDNFEKVSTECSSGIGRVVYSIPVVCS